MRRWLVALSLLALFGVGYGPAHASDSQAGSGSYSGPLGVIPARGAAVPSTAGGQLSYHNGPVMYTNTTYAIYWFPAGSSYSLNYRTLIDQYLLDVQADSGKTTNVYASDTQYYGTQGPIQYRSTFARDILDTDTFPKDGCTDTYTKRCLSDTQIRSEISHVISLTHLTPSPTTMFMLFTPRNVGSCYTDKGTTKCAFQYFCAYHSGFGSGSSVTLYSNQPYDAYVPTQCPLAESPNGDDADWTITAVSHEHNETITDEQGSGWYDNSLPQGQNENGDKCKDTYGSPLGGPPGAEYNQVINGHHYYTQEEWSNANNGCVLTYPVAPVPTVSAISPSNGSTSGGTSVTVTGTNFTGATSVEFGTVASASFTENSDTQITALSPAENAGTVDITVTTPGGTSAVTAADQFTYVQSGTITEFPIPTANSSPLGITAGPDGNLWFTEGQGNQIGQITPSGAITEFSVPMLNSDPYGITTGPDGNLWFTENSASWDEIGQMTLTGAVTGFPIFPISENASAPWDITAGPDGNLWFTVQSYSQGYPDQIGRITPSGTITLFPIPTSFSGPRGITAGPDGNLWFTESGANQIGRITPSGVVTEFPLPTADSYPDGITAGADGNLWFTEFNFNANQIGRITPSGAITEFPIPTANSGPSDITAGPDGNLWFTESDTNQIGRITP